MVNCKYLNYEKIGQEYIEGNMSIHSLAKKYNISHWHLRKNFTKLGIRKTIKGILNIDAFAEFTDENCYWAGFIAADGFITKSKRVLGITLAIKDVNHLIKFKKFLESNAKITIIEKINEENGRTYTYCGIRIYSVKLAKDLSDNFNIVNKKSLILKPPNKIPEEMIVHYIRGFIDGDGTIGWHKWDQKPRLSVCSGCRKFLEWVYLRIKENNPDVGSPDIFQREDSNTQIFAFKSNNLQKTLDWIFSNSEEEIRLDRKYQRYVDYKSRSEKLKIEKQQKGEEKQEFINNLIDLYNKGNSISDISDLLNISEQKAAYYLDGRVITRKNKMSGQYGKKLIERNLAILEYYNKGFTAVQIAEIFNLKKDTVWHSINRAKIHLNVISK